MSGVEIAWDELATAFESTRPDATNYFDRSTGHVVARSEEPLDGHLVAVPRLHPRDGYDDMRRFIATVPSAPLRERLRQAIQGRGAFRRFCATLAESPGEQQRWLVFRESSLYERIARWLEETGIEPLNPPAFPKVAETAAEPDAQVRLQDLTLLVLYLSSWEEVRGARGAVRRSWKGYRFEVLQELEQQGLLSQGRSAKSVFLTGEGIARARQIDARVRVSPADGVGEELALDRRPAPRAARLARPRRDPGRRYR